MFVTSFVGLGKFSSEQVCETMDLLCTLLFLFLTRNVIGYLCRTVGLVVDLSNRKKVFILATLPLSAEMQFQRDQNCESLHVFNFLKIGKEIIESLFRINP